MLPLVHAVHEHDYEYDPYFTSTWIVTAFMLSFYICLVMAAYPYTKTRIPIFAFFLLIFVPPLFFFYIFYLFLILSILRPPDIVEERSVVGQTRRVPQSRLEMSRV